MLCELHIISLSVYTSADNIGNIEQEMPSSKLSHTIEHLLDPPAASPVGRRCGPALFKGSMMAASALGNKSDQSWRRWCSIHKSRRYRINYEPAVMPVAVGPCDRTVCIWPS
ncbi:hypothetical protein WA026_018056 [Henosepilachna vigintioctopunctata]|uniref:Uncharacterized protein n=1 Tax=Henosepilachna vigintioctopunctata TaxID=420089 RepID=A0AAW1UGQ0_9CUCU